MDVDFECSVAEKIRFSDTRSTMIIEVGPENSIEPA